MPEKTTYLRSYDLTNADELLLIKHRAIAGQDYLFDLPLSHALNELAVAAERVYHIINQRVVSVKN